MININSNITITQYSASGEKIGSQKFHNLVVNGGLEYMVKHITGQTTRALYTYIIGTGTTPAASTDTALQSSAVNLLLSTYASTGGEVTFTGTLGTTVGWGSTFNEIGIFTSSSELIARSIFNLPITKTSTSLTTEKIDWVFEFEAAT